MYSGMERREDHPGKHQVDELLEFEVGSWQAVPLNREVARNDSSE